MTETEQIARLIPIEHIRPDPDQPRRLLPADLAQSLAASGSPFDILGQLRVRSERDKWLRERLQELDALAQSIADDGLMQPIRVIRDDDERYRIEEGERRWWAHHILVQQGKQQFQNISAFVVEPESASKGLLRRRVAENVHRSGFTAIELAQAMAKRIQEILTAEPGIKQGEVERRVGSENGMSDRRVRQFVALLTLSPEAQELAQQARLTENSLRGIVGIKDTAAQLAAIRALIHPSQPTAKTRRKTQTRERRLANHVSNRRRERRQKKQTLDTMTRRRKRVTNKLSRKNGLRRRENPNMVQRMQKLLLVARSFKQKDVRHLNSHDWMHIIEDKSNRDALMNLRDVLERALAIDETETAKKS
ncbi:MAG: ParB N-terminal domain-containing protein [Chloroflexi bacterium]|nr:ParB N-terminal domain-containing protein [Chloroflexota bacterium]